MTILNNTLLISDNQGSITGDAHRVNGGLMNISITGTFGGGTVFLDARIDQATDTEWVTLKVDKDPYEATENDMVVLDFLDRGSLIRARVSGASGENIIVRCSKAVTLVPNP